MEYNIQIAGFKSNIRDFRELIQNINEICKKEISKNQNCTVQLLNAQGIGGEEHVHHAAIHALKAFHRNENIAGDLGLEICVRTSGGRQISKALQILGLKEGNMDVCAVTVGCDGLILQKLEHLLQNRDDEVLSPDENVLKKLYGIPDLEEETAGSVVRALMERTSLLIVDG